MTVKTLQFGFNDLPARFAFEKWFYIHTEYTNSFMFRNSFVKVFCSFRNKSAFEDMDKKIGIDRFHYIGDDRLGEDKVKLEWDNYDHNN